jgi:hypothetical protein
VPSAQLQGGRVTADVRLEEGKKENKHAARTLCHCPLLAAGNQRLKGRNPRLSLLPLDLELCKCSLKSGCRHKHLGAPLSRIICLHARPQRSLGFLPSSTASSLPITTYQPWFTHTIVCKPSVRISIGGEMYATHSSEWCAIWREFRQWSCRRMPAEHCLSAAHSL